MYISQISSSVTGWWTGFNPRRHSTVKAVPLCPKPALRSAQPLTQWIELELRYIQSKRNNLFYYFQLHVSAIRAIIRLNTKIKEYIYIQLIWNLDFKICEVNNSC